MLAGAPVTAQSPGQGRQPWAVPRGWQDATARSPLVPGPIQFTEPEFPVGTRVDGLAISTLNGVPIGATTTFGYTQGWPSPDCTIANGPPPQMFVSSPGIEGDAGNGQAVLTVDFGADVDRVASHGR